jgi:2-iminobutanoate/2-iminopropanoate deaminase
VERHVTTTSAAPAAVGPYSQAIRCGETIYTAGQLGLDPETGKLVEGGIQDQTRQPLSGCRRPAPSGTRGVVG